VEFTDWLGLLLVLLLLTARAVLAGAKSAFSSARRSRLRQLAQDGGRWAGLAVKLADDASRMLGTLYLGKALLAALATVIAALTLHGPLVTAMMGAGLARIWSSLLSSLIVTSGMALGLIVGRLVPEAVAAASPEEWTLRLSPVVYFLEIVLWPLVRLTVWISNRLADPFGGTPFSGVSLITEEEIKTLVDAGEEEGVIEVGEREMIYSIFQLGDTLAREVMVPRIDMEALEVNTSLDAAREATIEAGHSRIPVYEETVDHIVGLLYAKDLLGLTGERGGAQAQLRDVLRPAYFVPETKKVDDLLQELQQRKIHMAVVIGEYGGTAGLVTVEDILEEIVGEIQDEYDIEEPILERTEDGAYILDARIDLDDLGALLGIDLPDDSGSTLGGLIYRALDKVPAPGETLLVGGLMIKVLTVVDKRICKVRLELESVGGRDDE
jgi:CBS domain containing-hemolysin-like protein